jgi:hypothetical protein
MAWLWKQRRPTLLAVAGLELLGYKALQWWRQMEVQQRLLAGGEVLVGRREHPTIEPGGTGCGAIVLQQMKARQMLTRVSRGVAVDFLQDLLHNRLAVETLRVLRLVVPDEVFDALIPWQIAAGIQLFEALPEPVGKPGVGTAIAGWVGGPEMPLQHTFSIGEAAFHLGHLGRGKKADLRLDVG